MPWGGLTEAETIALQKLLAQPSAVVYFDGSVIITRRSDGSELYRATKGVNDALAIQAALNDLTSGGRVILKRGTYACKTALTVQYAHTVISGESTQVTVLDFSSVVLTDALVGNGKEGLLVENLKFKSSNGQTHNAIRLSDGCNFWHLRDLYFENFDGSTVLLKSTTASGVGYGLAENLIIITPGNTGAGIGIGINLYATSPGFVNGNAFVKVHIIGASWGVAMQDTGAIANNKFVALSMEQGSIGVRILNSNAYDNLFDYHPDGGTLTSAITVTASDGNLFITDRATWTDGVTDDGKSSFLGNKKVGASILSGTFAIDALGIKTVTIAHGLAFAPALQECQVSVVEGSAVDDWAFNLLKVVSADVTNVVIKINVSTASASVGATAKIALRVGKP
ncbi:MAG: hypothetical protein QXJ74_05200 [Nitrososphaera sp.]